MSKEEKKENKKQGSKTLPPPKIKRLGDHLEPIHDFLRNLPSKKRPEIKALRKRDAFFSFRVVFAPELTPDQVKGALGAVAEYYRACGGAGLQVVLDRVEPPPDFGGV